MAERKARVAVLVSGGGTNLQAILDRQQEGIIHSGEVVLVISNVAGAYALTRAEKAGIATRTFTRKELGSRQHVEERILQEVLNGLCLEMALPIYHFHAGGIG